MYEYMLDSNMIYTCALYNSKKLKHCMMQINKVDVILNKMRINVKNGITGGNILDIGSGWGHLIG